MPIFPDLTAIHGAQMAYERGKAEAAAEIKRLREALEAIKEDLERCDWTCDRCHHDYGMTETDIYLAARDALDPPKPMPRAPINEVR